MQNLLQAKSPGFFKKSESESDGLLGQFKSFRFSCKPEGEEIFDRAFWS